MYEEVAGKKFDEFKLKEELWHYEIDKWAIYQFRKRRREIRTRFGKKVCLTYARRTNHVAPGPCKWRVRRDLNQIRFKSRGGKGILTLIYRYI